MRRTAVRDIKILSQLFVATGKNFIFFTQDFYLLGVFNRLFLQLVYEVFQKGDFCF